MVTNENKQDSKVEKKMDDIFMGVLMELLFFIVWCSLETSNIKKITCSPKVTSIVKKGP